MSRPPSSSKTTLAPINNKPSSKKNLFFSSAEDNQQQQNSSSSSYVSGTWQSGTSSPPRNFQANNPAAILSSSLAAASAASTSNKQQNSNTSENNNRNNMTKRKNNSNRGKDNANSSSSSFIAAASSSQSKTSATVHQKSKINFPIFNPVSYGQNTATPSSPSKQKRTSPTTTSTFLTDDGNNNKDRNDVAHSTSLTAAGGARPYTVEAAGNVPLVGEWLAQRRFLLFPRAPTLRDAFWCWALLKSYVLRRDCMNEVNAMRTAARNNALSSLNRTSSMTRRSTRRTAAAAGAGSGSQSPVASIGSGGGIGGSPAGSPRRVGSFNTNKKTTVVKILGNSENTINNQNTNTSSTVDTDQQTPPRQSAMTPTPQNHHQSGKQAWVGTPSRNLLSRGARTSMTPTPGSSSSKRKNTTSSSDANIFSPSPVPHHHHDNDEHDDETIMNKQHILSNPKNNLETNKHAQKLRDALLSVERRKMWYEKFDASRRAERDSLSEKRQREATNKNAIKEWTWEEDEMLIARRQQQEERNALAKKLAREKLERIQHATKSLGISAPIVMTDFSYMNITYFFELLALRPRNAREVENLDHIKMLKFGDPSQTKNKTDDEILEEEEKLKYVMEEDSFTRYVLDAESYKKTGSMIGHLLPESVIKMRKERPQPIVKTSNGIRVEDLSTSATFSELLKLYRRYLVAQGTPIDIWKEEDMAFSSAASSAAAQENTSNNSSQHQQDTENNNNNTSSAANASSSSLTQPRLHPGDKNFNHFPTSNGIVDKVSQRFYTRFLPVDFGKQISSQNPSQSILQNTKRSTEENERRLKKLQSTVSSGYLFDVDPPPQLPYIHGLKLKGNKLVDNHVVQFPNGNWRSIPGPISSFHDMTFVLTVRCPLWRLTLVSLDLSENHLTRLPAEVVEIPKLHSLFLHGNRFTSLESIEKLSEKRGAQMLRISLNANPVMDILGLTDYSNRIKTMFPLLSHLDNVYIPCNNGNTITS